VVLLGITALLATVVAAPAASAAGSKNPGAVTSKAVFFAADGLRQDLVQGYADKGVMPTMRSFLRNGA
jgi:hypothetical protein